MRQVVQDQGQGTIRVLDIPAPILGESGLLVRTLASVISSGTERAKIEMGEKSTFGKARARPDLAKKVVEQARRDGIRATADLVRDRLGTPQALGYSAAGIIERVGGQSGGFEPGQLVALAGAGYANHAEVNYAPATLATPVPDGVKPEHAAFATLGSIALHGIRQAALTPGELVVVSGLGLIGQLTVKLLRAYGHPVVGVDPSPLARSEVSRVGVDTREPDDPALSRMVADAVLLTAATKSDDLVRSAPGWCRDRGRVVVVGDVGLGLERPAYYDNEIDVRFSRSYGPGRYDPNYEEQARDYPIGYVRWTEGRNLAEIIRLLAEKSLDVSDLIDARYPLEEAPKAYERLAHGERARALVLTYGETSSVESATVTPTVASVRRKHEGRLRVSVCGAGNFARKTLLPALDKTGAVDWAYISTASGLTAHHVAQQRGFAAAVATPEEALTREGVDAALIATRHDSHAPLGLVAAERDLPCYIEKPLALDEGSLAKLESVPGSGFLTTGFNRRAAPATRAALDKIRARKNPAVLQIRVNAGSLPPGHWANTAEQGGRIVGELCHFIDLACHLVGAPVAHVTAVGTGLTQPLLEDTLQVLARHTDGSSTTIGYFAQGSSDLPKERIEAHWDGQSFVADDFRHWWLDDGRGLKRQGSRRQDKGHAALIASFVDFARGIGSNPVPFHQAAHVTRVSFAVVDALAEGKMQVLPAVTW